MTRFEEWRPQSSAGVPPSDCVPLSTHPLTRQPCRRCREHANAVAPVTTVPQPIARSPFPNPPAAEMRISIQTFLERVEAGTATVADAKECVVHHREILYPLPVEGRQADLKAVPVGAPVLKWLLKQRDRDLDSRIYEDSKFANALCWLLVCEDLEEFAWHWIEIECDEREKGDMTATREINGALRTEALIGGLVNASLHLAADDSASVHWNPEHMTRAYLRAYKMATRRSGGLGKTSLSNSLQQVMRKLCQADCPPTDPVLFDAFLGTLESLIAKDKLAYARATARLFHPTRATGKPFLQLLRDRDGALASALAAKGTSKEVLGRERRAGLSLVRAAYILRLQGDAERAAFVDSIVEAQVPARTKDWAKLLHERNEADEKLDWLRGARPPPQPQQDA
ncbi:hypothetical protein LTR53_003539 [Teratosphaeriaceae sp. CCFEE 6253]|nr:hypothetical protein LTR53_003539 [Teratosphaeriaceae sp. CCFEE 6253]